MALAGEVPSLFAQHGRMSKNLRSALAEELAALPPDVPRVLLATKRRVGGEAPPPATLVLVTPVSWNVAAVSWSLAP
jgi:hypothetical protein